MQVELASDPGVQPEGVQRAIPDFGRVLSEQLRSLSDSGALLGGRFRLVLDHRRDTDGVFHVALDEKRKRMVRCLGPSLAPNAY